MVADCVFYRGDVIFIVYVDDDIFLGSLDGQLFYIITKMQNLNLNIEDQGHPVDYAEVNIKCLKDCSIEWSQQALINAIIEDANLEVSKMKASFTLNFNY
jgi:hypothetical protein